MRYSHLILTIIMSASFGVIATAETPPAHDHMKKMVAIENASPSTKAYNDANTVMHRDMAITFSGDADVDFVKGMIPHHQGAVDMANIVLKYGKDPEIKKMAHDVIKAQTTEIAFMNEWLKKHGK